MIKQFFKGDTAILCVLEEYAVTRDAYPSKLKRMLLDGSLLVLKATPVSLLAIQSLVIIHGILRVCAESGDVVWFFGTTVHPAIST